MTTTELTCQELVEIVTDYLEDRLPLAERRRFEQHVAGCEGCRNYLDQMRETIHLVGALREDAIPVPIRERMLRAFRDWRS
jgi:anti-sigma factor RsiW